MDIKRTEWLVGIVLFLIAAPVFAWRCERGFVDTGDSMQAVREKCGQPAFTYGGTGKRAQVLWYYDSGPAQLVRILEFRGNVLENISTGGYGLSAPARACTPADLRTGMQVYELATRCGKPRTRRALGQRGAQRTRAHTEIWVYDFGAQYLLHKVTIVGGEVQSVETAGRRTPRT